MSLFDAASPGAAAGPMTFTVAELADRIKQVLGDAFGGDLWVEGEIRNLSRARSGHVYFDLVEPSPDSGASKQPEASISVALFRFNRERVEETLRRHGGMAMEDGMKVRIQSELDFWPPRGRLQLYMSGIDPNFTLGELEAERLRLLEKLRDEGLLAKNQAVPFPVAPLRIGLVTSNGSAAHHDFCDELEASGLAWDVVLADTPVQGIDAPPFIAAAIGAVGRAGVDVIAVVRGGGARTDLVAFDNETVARAIANAPVPVVTGIGHEIDRTIADEVAHEAQKTPTAAAVFILTAARAHLEAAEHAWGGIAGWAQRLLDDADQRLAAVSQTTGPGRRGPSRPGGQPLGEPGGEDSRLGRDPHPERDPPGGRLRRGHPPPGDHRDHRRSAHPRSDAVGDGYPSSAGAEVGGQGAGQPGEPGASARPPENLGPWLVDHPAWRQSCARPGGGCRRR